MKETVKSILFAGAAFGAGMTAVASPFLIVLAIMGQGGLALALACFLFLFTSLPFGIAMGAFAGHQRNRFLSMDLVPEGETLIHQGGANHMVGLEGVGGWLWLTDRALRFVSHRVNIQCHELSIPIEDIAEIIPCRTLQIIPNGLLVKTAGGRTERFVVNGRRSWTRVLREIHQSASQ